MSISSQPLVSVVTPVYNGAEFLSECIESVLRQTYGNWEHIIVDNCSTDGSAEIARRYAARDSRMRLCQTGQFLKPIANHNHALRQISSQSKYCKVVFADDWIFPRCLEEMVEVAEQNPTVGLVGAYVLEGSRIACTGLEYPARLVAGREICRRHLLKRLYIFGSANSVLYRSDLVRVRSPFYNETNIHADTEVCFDLLKDSDFGFVHQVLTFTRPRPGSLTSISDDLQTNLAGTLQILKHHGSSFLTPSEFELYINRHLGLYHEFLAKARLRGRRDVWTYHKQKFAELGLKLGLGQLVMAGLRSVVRAALSPGNALRRLIKGNADERVIDSEHLVKNL